MLIAIDLCQPMITYQKLTKKNANLVRKEKILNQNVTLSNLKIIDDITNVKNAEKYAPSQQTD